MPFQSLVNALPTELQPALQSGIQTGAIALTNPGLKGLFPLIHPAWVQALVIVLAYLITLWGSGHVVRYFVDPPKPTPMPPNPDGSIPHRPRFDPSWLIGKCENILVVTLVIAGQYSGLGLIFAAKAWARSKDIEHNAAWFLGGTLVNLVWAMLVALAARIVVFGL